MVLKRNSSNFLFYIRWYDLLSGSDIDGKTLAEVSSPVVRVPPVILRLARQTNGSKWGQLTKSLETTTQH